jgi:secondary thiamine-phosphate synthase enzyme
MVVSTSIGLRTNGDCDIIDITQDVARKVQEAKVRDGTVTIFVSGSTAGVTTIEYERGVLGDLCAMWDRAIPRDIPYRHDAAWGDGNGHAHVRASLLGPSLVVPFVGGRMTLGTWQQIVLVDFDNRPRSREIVLQIMGE